MADSLLKRYRRLLILMAALALAEAVPAALWLWPLPASVKCEGLDQEYALQNRRITAGSRLITQEPMAAGSRGDQGRALLRAADAFMERQEIVNPERFAAILAPGWGAG